MAICLSFLPLWHQGQRVKLFSSSSPWLCAFHCNTMFSNQASFEKRSFGPVHLLINHLCSVLDTSASASYYLRFIRSIVTFCSRLIRKFSSQSSIFNLASMLLSNNLLILLQEYFLYTCQSFVVHNQTQHNYTHIFNTDMKIKESLQVSC